MPRLQTVLAAKGAFAIVVLGLPLLFLPLEGFQLLDIPEFSGPSLLFIRLCGALVITVATFQLWGAFDPSHARGTVIGTVVECVLTLMLVWHFVFYGDLATWPILGKMIVVGLGLAQLAFFASILGAGWGALLGRSTQAGSEPG